MQRWVDNVSVRNGSNERRVMSNEIQRAIVWVALLITQCSLLSAAAQAADHFVAPNGTPQGDGSILKPWDLQTAFNQPVSVKPGDTIWVRGGTYHGSYACKLAGGSGSGQQIIVRNYQGERATIDSGTNETYTAIIDVMGHDTWVWGLELMSSNPIRQFSCTPSATVNCSWQNGIQRLPGSITEPQSNNTKFINLVVHDTQQGFDCFKGSNVEIYGALMYYNGWSSQGGTNNRGHGHAIYMQNPQTPPSYKLVAETIAFDGFAIGQRVYGSGNAFAWNVEFRGNVSFDQGILYGGYTGLWQNYLFTVGSGAHNMVFSENHSYFSQDSINGMVQLGYYWTPRDYNLIAQNNYFIGGNNPVEILKWDQISFTNNTTYSRTGFPINVCILQDQLLSNWALDNNQYYGPNKFQFSHACQPNNPTSMGSMPFSNYQQQSTLDAHSMATQGPPTGTWTFVRPNKYELGRANIIIYNWDRLPNVSVDISKSGLSIGQSFEIRDVQNFYGPPVLAETYTGSPITLPTNLTTIAPVVITPLNPAPSPYAPPHHTPSEFQVFILLPAGTGTAASPCDIDGDGSTNVLDVQQEVNMALGISACTADINKDSFCNIIDVQRVVNAALGGSCVSP